MYCTAGFCSTVRCLLRSSVSCWAGMRCTGEQEYGLCLHHYMSGSLETGKNYQYTGHPRDFKGIDK